MTYTPERASVNARVQIGAESAIGTSVACGKLLDCFDFVFGINGDLTQYAATGHKYDQVSEQNTEWTDFTTGGLMDYNGVLYPLCGVMGVATPVVHLSSITAKDWVLTPPVSGSVAPQTYSMQQGDSVRAHEVAYGLFTDFGYTLTRKDIKLANTKGIAQAISDGATLTSNPTAVALATMVAKQFNVYLDSTSTGLGTTQLLKVLQVDYAFSGVYGPFWSINRANTSFTAHVDLKPKSSVKLKVEADSVGMGLLTSLRQGTTQFLRIDAQGAQIASDGPGAINNEFMHDMAIKIGKPSTFSDDSGIFAIEWDCDIVEDATWGKAQTITVTNLITAL